MKFIKTYLLIIIGAIILFTANVESLKMPYLYIVGIIVLMVGLFNISRSIRSKDDLEKNREDNEF